MPRVCLICGKKSPEVTLFRFPADEERRKTWADGLELDSSDNQLKRSSVCHLHFSQEHFGGVARKKLANDAIPSARLYHPEPEVDEQCQDCAPEIKDLQEKIKKLQSQLEKLTNDPEPSFILGHFSKLRENFSENQYDFLNVCLINRNKKKQGLRFNDQVKTLASKFYFKNPPAYKHYVELGFPSRWTIARFNQEKVSRTGWSNTIGEYLKTQAETLLPSEKHCVLAFDETEVKPEFYYNQKLDVVDGFADLGHLGRESEEAKKVLVFILRNLNSRWEQAVSYYFTQKTIDAEKLRDLVEINISKCLQAGFDIVAISSDSDSKKLGLEAFQGSRLHN